MSFENPKIPANTAKAAAEIAVRFLREQTLCTIATLSSRRDVRANTAYFAWDGNRDLYFISEKATQHSQNIKYNGKAAANIFERTTAWGEPISGLQVFGSAREASGAKIEKGLHVYREKFTPSDEFLKAGLVGDFAGSAVYVLEIKEIKVIAEKLLGSDVYVTLFAKG